MTEPERLKLEDLEVGMEVCVPFRISVGWSCDYRYSKYVKCKVLRVTPKKTKAVLNGGLELDRHSIIYKPCEELERRTKVAQAYSRADTNIYKLNDERYKALRRIDDEAIMKVDEKLKEIIAILEESSVSQNK